jgi:hypothetical protein
MLIGVCVCVKWQLLLLTEMLRITKGLLMIIGVRVNGSYCY